MKTVSESREEFFQDRMAEIIVQDNRQTLRGKKKNSFIQKSLNILVVLVLSAQNLIIVPFHLSSWTNPGRD